MIVSRCIAAHSFLHGLSEMSRSDTAPASDEELEGPLFCRPETRGMGIDTGEQSTCPHVQVCWHTDIWLDPQTPQSFQHGMYCGILWNSITRFRFPGHLEKLGQHLDDRCT